MGWFRRVGHGSRGAALLGAAALLLPQIACRSKPSNGGRPAGSASATPPAPFACEDVPKSKPLVLGQARKPPDATAEARDEEDADVELPFAVELGAARSGAGYFVVGGIDSRRGASFAFLALVEANGGSATTVELGRVFGEVEPPTFSPYGDGFVGLVAGNDAGAGFLKIVALARPFTEATLRRGAEITGMRRDAAEFALEASAGSVLAAWTRLEKGAGRIALGRIDAERLALIGEAFAAPLPLAGEAESPRLVGRAGGYFLAWVARGAAARPKIVPARNIDSDAGAPTNLLEEGPTAIEIALLDAAGVAVGNVRRVTPEGARVVAFDLAKAPDGGALVVYRDERDGPGLDRPDAQAVWIHPDGSLASRSWETGDGVGLPSLLAEPDAAPGKPWAWVFVPSERELALAPLADPLALPELLRDERSRGAEALAQAGGRFLFARGRNGQRELSVVECRGNSNAAPHD